MHHRDDRQAYRHRHLVRAVLNEWALRLDSGAAASNRGSAADRPDLQADDWNRVPGEDRPALVPDADRPGPVPDADHPDPVPDGQSRPGAEHPVPDVEPDARSEQTSTGCCRRAAPSDLASVRRDRPVPRGQPVLQPLGLPVRPE